MPLPRVTVHLAQSLDGRIALEGAPARLSADEGIAVAHQARAEHDAVLVGARTLWIDNPRLNVRAVSGPNPIRVVLSSTLAVPHAAQLFGDENGGPSSGGRVIVIGAEGRATEDARRWLVARGVDALVVAATPSGWVCPRHALEALAGLGVNSVLVEGGARILTSFFRERLVTRAQIEIAMRILGEPALPAIGSLGFAALHETIRLEGAKIETIGTNFLVRGDVAYGS